MYGDAAEASLTVADVKHYFYCPKIVYFEKVLHAEPYFTSQQESSKEKHVEIEGREKRRKATLFYSPEFRDASKQFKVHLYSQKLNLEGTLDCLIRIGQELIPVDYRYMRSKGGKIWLDHKYQLTAYSLLLEENFDSVVRRGYVYYVPEEITLPLRISEGTKDYLRKVVGKLAVIVETQAEPEARAPPQRCSGGCVFLWICGGVLRRG